MTTEAPDGDPDPFCLKCEDQLPRKGSDFCSVCAAEWHPDSVARAEGPEPAPYDLANAIRGMVSEVRKEGDEQFEITSSLLHPADWFYHLYYMCVYLVLAQRYQHCWQKTAPFGVRLGFAFMFNARLRALPVAFSFVLGAVAYRLYLGWI